MHSISRHGRRALDVLLTCSATMSVAANAEAQALPEGNVGIAAQHPNDQGIHGHPDVVFADDFEGVAGSELPSGGKWDNVYGSVKITQSPSLAHSGSRAVELHHLEAERSYGAWRDFGVSGFDALHVRYYMKFDAAFPGLHHQGMSIFGGAPGVTMGSSTGKRPNGSNHFTVLLDNIDPAFDWSPPGSTSPGFQYVYCYHMDQGSEWGDVFRPDGSISPNQRSFSGPSFTPRANTIPQRGVWIAFELMVRLNTPGQSDGRIAYWIDGALAADFPGLRFRDVSSLKANFVVLSSYASTNRPNQRLWYDDVVVARSYIGPQSTQPAPTGGGDAGPPGTTPPGGDVSSEPPFDGGESGRPRAPNDSPEKNLLDTPSGSGIDEAEGACTVGRRPAQSSLLGWAAALLLVGITRRRHSAHGSK